MSFYSIFSSLKGFEAGLITVHKPFLMRQETSAVATRVLLSRSNHSSILRWLRFFKPRKLCLGGPRFQAKSLSHVIHWWLAIRVVLRQLARDWLLLKTTIKAVMIRAKSIFQLTLGLSGLMPDIKGFSRYLKENPIHYWVPTCKNNSHLVL